jgi:hypothetical protein
MILPSLILILIIGGIASWIVAARSTVVARWIAIASVLTNFAMSLGTLADGMQLLLDSAVRHSVPSRCRWAKSDTVTAYVFSWHHGHPLFMD